MPATIKIKNSSTTGAVPTSSDLVQGELAVNVTDLGLYTENASGTVVKLNAPSIDDKNTGATKRLTIDTSGNLGLGVTPSAWSGQKALEFSYGGFSSGTSLGTAVVSNAYYNGTNWIYRITTSAAYYLQDSGGHKWFYAGSGTAGNAITFTQAMTLDSSGNMGLGTTSPARRLDVRGGTGIQVNEDGSGTKVITIRSDFAGVDPAINVTTNNALLLMTNNTERARIESSGNLLVGTTSAAGKFTSVSTTTTPAGYFSTSGVGRVLQVMSTSGADSAQPGIYIGKFANDSTTSQRFMLFSINNDATGSGQINANGASQAAFGSFSDARLKENIVDLAPQLSNIMALRPVEFDYKTGGHQTGFVAQEMQQVFPDAVGSDGSEDQYLTVTGWNKTEAILVKAIQEQQAIITALTARITALEQA
jgi:hypothetical protein